MDQIRLTGIRATGKHGVLDFEHERAQTSWWTLRCSSTSLPPAVPTI